MLSQLARAKVVVAETQEWAPEAAGMVYVYKGDGVIGVTAQYGVYNGQKRMSLLMLVVTAPGPSGPPGQLLKPLVVIFHISQMGYKIPECVLQLLCTAQFAIVTVNLDAEFPESLRQLLTVSCEEHGLLQKFWTQRVLDLFTVTGNDSWHLHVFGPAFVMPSFPLGDSWPVSLVDGLCW